MTAPDIDGARLLARLDAFAAIGATPAGGVNRQALSDGDRTARAMMADIGRARGFAVSQDAAANLFLRRGGEGTPFLIGSHLDSQPTGGRFDGALGTLTALEVLESIDDAGIVTPMPLELVVWTNEEGSRFAPGAMGSQSFARGRLPDGLDAITGTDGAPLAGELAATLAALRVPMRPLGGTVAGYLELHIEQGPSLEARDLAIGVVTGIQGTRWLEIGFDGEVGHAGTTGAAYRRDAMAAAAAAIHVLAGVMAADPDARLTVGRIEAEPGSVNVIAGRVQFSVDLRHPDLATLAALEAEVLDACRTAAAANRCAVHHRRTLDIPPARFDPRLVALVEAAAARVGAGSARMVSGAFHDALFLAGVAPAAMVFVPCRDGISHNEAEFVEPRHVITGARVLLEATLAAMAG